MRGLQYAGLVSGVLSGIMGLLGLTVFAFLPGYVVQAPAPRGSVLIAHFEPELSLSQLVVSTHGRVLLSSSTTPWMQVTVLFLVVIAYAAMSRDARRDRGNIVLLCVATVGLGTLAVSTTHPLFAFALLPAIGCATLATAVRLTSVRRSSAEY